MLRKILQPFYTVYVAISFSASVLAGFPLFALISCGNNFTARKMIFTIVKWWAGWWLWTIGMPVRKEGTPPRKGRYVVVANHISYLDTIVIFRSVPGYFRPLGKKEISGIPVIGLIYRQIAVMVDRSLPQSRATSLRLLWRVLKAEGSILIFPEGTFNETGAALKSFYDGAFRLAINTQTPILPIVFPDTVDRWHYSAWWKLWPGKNRAVYLDAIEMAGLALEDLDAVKQKVYAAMERELLKHK